MGEYVCRDCGARYAVNQHRWKCDCGGLLDLDFQPSLDIDQLPSKPQTIWRYRDALPVPEDAGLTLGEGCTPMLSVEIGGREVLIKQEQLFPTGSYKDRGAVVMIAVAEHLGIQRVVEDSSGNAGCSVAAYCATAGIDCRIFVPASTSPGKMGQIELYGAELVRVPGSRENTAQMCMAAAKDAYYASHVFNPYFFHGTKTFAYEVVEQLGWQAPDSVVLPAGNGTLVIGSHIGFNELFSLGIIDKVPRLIAVQSANCAPLYHSFQKGSMTTGLHETSPTLAEGIAIADPKRGEQILEAVKATDGFFLTVDEKDILTAFAEMGRRGFCIEPTSSAVIAGVQKYLEIVKDEELVVSLFSGHGLKAGEKIHKLIHSF